LAGLLALAVKDLKIMAHTHQESETYYLDQLCLIALSGAFGGVCLSLYFWQRNMLTLMLGGQFHLWVLGSGIVLVLLALIRAGLLWTSVGKQDHDHEHGDHDHHDHGHAHEHGPHDHGHHHHEGFHEHAHEHGPEHHHHHAHDHDDHDHDWAPWRYVVLLIPILLFVLGLPNKGPQVRAATAQVDMTQEGIGYAMLIESGGDPLKQLTIAAALTAEGSGPPTALDFKTLEKASIEEEDRKYWQGKRVGVKGQFAPSPNSDRVFSLVRFRIRCCAADAIPLNVPMIAKEPITGIKEGEWVEVTGRVEFQKGRNGYQTLLRVPNRKAIAPSDPDPNPWVAN
jgi:hypothetical protein